MAHITTTGWRLAVLVAASAAVGAAADPPPTREASVINTFQVMCFSGPTDFDVIGRRAAAMNMKLMMDKAPPAATDVALRSKIWNGSLPTGPFGLFLDEMNSRKGTATACAVSADVSDVDAFRAQLIQTLRLPLAPPPRVADGERSFVWDHFTGFAKTLIVRDMSPSGKSSVMIKFVSAQKR